MVLDDEAKNRLRQIEENNRAIEAHSDTSERKPFRVDGYINLLNKYGTAQDNSEAYRYASENQTPDTILMTHYEQNGLFGKIIDIPAQEAVKKGFKLNIADAAVEDYIQKKVRRMKFFTTVEESLKWSRLFGGALAVMIIDDGINDLTKPVNWKKAKKIDEIVVYDRSVVTPDYQSMYRGVGVYGTAQRSKFRMPEYYNVFSIYGSFRVHESRCLIFRNGKMPEKASTSDYRFWGVPEYNHIKRAMRETITAHGDAVKLLERSVQAVYKTKNLAQMLSTDEGENDVLRRLQLIDTARGILNSIAIDADGEDYDFKTITLSGVKEVIDSACNMLSALTEIPQTKLFGRSPAGMNATGESDLENYYSFIDKIRESQIKDNLCSLIDGIIQIGINNKELTERPDYELEFEPLWNEKESERATIDQTNAQTDLTKAQTAQLYIDMGVLDPAEERKRLKNEGKFGIEDEELPQQDIDQPFGDLIKKLNADASDDTEWITVNGAHIPLDENGVAQAGGDLKGEKLGKSTTQSRTSPSLKSPKDFDDYVSQNGLTPIYRGYSAESEEQLQGISNGIKTGKSTKSGEGTSALGKGVYFASTREEAEGYAGRRRQENGHSASRVNTAALDVNARIGDYDEVRQEQSNEIYELVGQMIKVKDQSSDEFRELHSKYESVRTMDISDYALSKGYDALYEHGTRYTVVLNQNALVVRDDAKDSPYKGATGVGVLVVKDGKFLVGNRDDNNQVGSPGGHIESWEDAERAAMRETEEEFGITLKNLIPLGMLDNLPQEYGRSFAFLSTDFDGTPLTNTQEMLNNRFTELQGLQNEVLYEPFKAALDKLFSVLEINAMYSDDEDDTPKDADTDEADTSTDNADAEADDNASDE